MVDLYSFDVSSCTPQLIGSPGYYFVDIALTPNRKLYGIVNATGDLYQIDTLTAASTYIGNIGMPAVSLVDLNDSTLLISYAKKLYGVRVSDASTFYIDSIGYNAGGDLTWYDNYLYMSTTGSFVKIELDSNYSSILNVTYFGNPFPICYGAVTSPFIGEPNSIVAFGGKNVFKVCPIDGTYDTLCISILPVGVVGGAALRLPIQQFPPTSCIWAHVNEYESSEFSIMPNPSSGSFKIKMERLSEQQIEIFNLLGGKVYSEKLKSEMIYLNQPAGIYFVKVSDGEKVYTQKLVVE